MKGSLINELELGYAPMSAYAFRRLIRDKDFHENVDDSHLYIIAQRREITFNNFVIPPMSGMTPQKSIKFEIKQEKNPHTIQCVLPLFQEHIGDYTKGLDVRLQNRNNTFEERMKPPYNRTQGIIFQEVDEKTNERKHIIWFSPEKLLQNYWKGHIKVDLSGDFKEMLKYRVHYVGKSTEQNICKRLSNHSTFQEILTNESALTYGNIPSNEIVVLLLRIKNNIPILKWGKDDDESGEEMAYYMENLMAPDDIDVSLNAEKALIKHLQPEYNRILYKSYPKKNDLISQDVYNVILYSIEDPISLIYDEGCIKGGDLFSDRDYIKVEQKK